MSVDSLASEFAQLPADLHDEIDLGSLVEVNVGGQEHYGVVRWCGKPKTASQQCLVGVELVKLFNVFSPNSAAHGITLL